MLSTFPMPWFFTYLGRPSRVSPKPYLVPVFPLPGHRRKDRGCRGGRRVGHGAEAAAGCHIYHGNGNDYTGYNR